jgi:hypothetical protein
VTQACGLFIRGACHAQHHGGRADHVGEAVAVESDAATSLLEQVMAGRPPVTASRTCGRIERQPRRRRHGILKSRRQVIDYVQEHTEILDCLDPAARQQRHQRRSRRQRMTRLEVIHDRVAKAAGSDSRVTKSGGRFGIARQDIAAPPAHHMALQR